MADMEATILQMMQVKGPILPTQARKQLKLDSLYIGAYLSTLVSKGKVKVTNLKIGGSPLYYLPEHTHELERFTQYLNEKDQRIWQRLKEEGVLQDTSLTPLEQVSVRNIKDFAVELRVNKTEVFWKYVLVSQEEATDKIKKIMGVSKEEPVQEKQAVVQQESTSEEQPVTEMTIPAATTSSSAIKNHDNVSSDKKDNKENTSDTNKNEHRDSKSASEEQVTLSHNAASATTEKKKEEEEKKQVQQAEEKQEDIDDPLYEKISSFLSSKGISIHDAKVLRKKKEFECIVTIPSELGDMRYYCLVKDKKKSNDNDVGSAYLNAQQRHLPAMYITTGSVQKNAQAKLDKMPIHVYCLDE